MHVHCANAGGGGDADQGDDQQQNAATAQCVGKAGSAPSDTVLCSRHKQADLFLEIPLDGHVFVDRGIREGGHEHLASVPGKDTVWAGRERRQLCGDRVDVWVGKRRGQSAQLVGGCLQRVLDMFELRRLPHERSFADHVDQEMAVRGHFKRRTRIRKLRNAFRQPRVRTVQSVVEGSDLRTNRAAFRSDVFERREVCIEPLTQAQQLARRLSAVELLQLLQGRGEVAALLCDQGADGALLVRGSGVDQAGRGRRNLA